VALQERRGLADKFAADGFSGTEWTYEPHRLMSAFWSLNKDAPINRAIQYVGDIVSVPVLGGLHHYLQNLVFGTHSDFDHTSGDNHALAVCGREPGAHQLNYLIDRETMHKQDCLGTAIPAGASSSSARRRSGLGGVGRGTYPISAHPAQQSRVALSFGHEGQDPFRLP
jgi:hypothetical protein